MRISDWSSDVCSSDLLRRGLHGQGRVAAPEGERQEHQPQPARLLSRLQAGDPALSPRRPTPRPNDVEIGRAWCRERGCQYVSVPVVAVELKNKRVNVSKILLAFTQNIITTIEN